MKHLTTLAMLTVGSFFTVALQAQEAEAPMTLSFSHTQFADADLDRGGELGSTQTSLGLGYDWSKGRGEAIGLSVGVGLKDYDFSGATIIPGADAWGQVTELDLGMSWRRPIGESGMLFIAPNLRSARGEGADWGDSLQFGLIASYGYRVSRTLTFGIGAGIFTGLEETSGFPVLLVNWQISDNWRLGNSFRAGPSGPAGLELAYTPAPGWEVGFGGGWRSDRFRLDENGSNPDGIGEVEALPVYLRLSWEVNDSLSLGVFGGVFLNGEVTTETDGGSELASDDLDSAPFFGVSANSRF